MSLSAPTAPLSSHFPREKSPNCYQASLVLANDLMGHVVGRGSRRLKQVSDLSGAHLSAFSQQVDGCEECLITIRGTKLQLGEALVILSKQVTHKHVYAPKKKRDMSSSALAPAPGAPVPAAAPAGGFDLVPRPPGMAQSTTSAPWQSAPALIITPPPPTSTLLASPLPPTPVQHSTPTTPLLLSCQSSHGSPMALSTPAGTETPAVPSVSMATPNSTSRALTPMEVDAILVVAPFRCNLTNPHEQRVLASTFWSTGHVICMLDGWEAGGDESS
jgi:hypothetical protein